MLTDQGQFDTTNAGKYLKQLCTHFGHKVEVTHTDTEGTIALGMGPATLRATDGTLVAEVSAPTADELDHARQIIDNHLARFAFRENFEAMSWRGPYQE